MTALPKPIEENKAKAAELFKPASEAQATDWEQAHNRRFVDLLRLSDHALGHVMANVKEGVPYEVDVGVGELRIHLCVGGEAKAPEAKPKTTSTSVAAQQSLRSVEEVVKSNSDLELKVVNGAKHVFVNKFLADQWGPLNEELRALGYKWIREGKTSHWEAP